MKIRRHPRPVRQSKDRNSRERTTKSEDYQPGAGVTQAMTMKVSKGLEFPVVALPGVGHMPAAGEDEKEAARVFYVAVMRAVQNLVIGVSKNGELHSG